MNEVKICPVCDGRQIVPINLYLSQGGHSIGDNSEVECRSCNGKGYIVVPGETFDIMVGEQVVAKIIK